MAIRNDTYTMYNDKEYRVWNHNGYARLISHDVLDLGNGFTELEPEENLNPRIFFKMVSPEEVSDVYEISTYVIYQGFEFSIWEEDENAFTLFSSERIYVDKLDFKMLEPGIYLKKVKTEDLDLIFEKKRLIPNYFD